MPVHISKNEDEFTNGETKGVKVNPQHGLLACHYAKDAIFVSNDMPFP